MTKSQFQMIMTGLLYILYALAFPSDNSAHVHNFWELQDAYTKEIKEG